jgi:sugar phosphate isomerase/epimerase
MVHRRQFIRLASTTGAALVAAAQAPKPLRLGVIAHCKDPDAGIARVKQLGFTNAQVMVAAYDDATAKALRAALDKYSIEPTALIVTGPGPEVYNFRKGPLTIGLVPREYRATRLERFKQAVAFCKLAGIPGVQGHAGFLPENPNDPTFAEVVEALRTVAGYCKQSGLTFRMETGQETPVALLRVIKAVGLDNVGVNLDPANLILYGKANPVDALDLLGPLILGVHAKDGRYPTDPEKLGEETAIGQGQVDFPRFIAKLKQVGYRGPITIEREISGPRQEADIRASKTYLEKLIG